MALNLSTGFRNSLLIGEGWKEQFDGGVIQIYSGAQPDTADLSATGTLLGTISIMGASFVPGLPANGLVYEISGVYVQKPDTDLWYLRTVGAGTVGWFRVVGNATDTGDSLTLARVDGAIGTSAAPAEMVWDVTTVATDTTYRLDSFLFTLPPF